MKSSGKGSKRTPNVNLTKMHKPLMECLNIHCKHGNNLIPANETVCRYYRVDYKQGKKVCLQCFVHFKEHLEHLGQGNGKHVLDNPINNNQIIKLSDNDNNGNKIMIKSKPNISDVYNDVEVAVKDYFQKNQNILDKNFKPCKITTSKVNDIILRINRDIKTANNLLSDLCIPSVSRLNSMDICQSNNNIETKIFIKDIQLNTTKKKTNKEKYGIDKDAIIINRTYMEMEPSIPILADKNLVYPPVNQELEVYGMKFSLLEPWYKCTIQSLISNNYVFVKFVPEEMILNKTQLAYTTEHPEQFSVGTRVISKLSNKNDSNYYAGIIGESPNTINKFRYLTFFDNGNFQYQNHKDIRLIINTSDPVWPLVHPNSQEFIRNYLATYPDCNVLNLANRQYVKINYKNAWKTAKVVDMDASLVKLYLPDSKHCEWLYRGSLRFFEMYATQEMFIDGFQCVESEAKMEPSIEITENKLSVNITKNESSVKISKNVAIKSTGKVFIKNLQTNSNTEPTTTKSTTTKSTTTKSTTTKSTTTKSTTTKSTTTKSTTMKSTTTKSTNAKSTSTKCTRNNDSSAIVKMIYSSLPDPILKPKVYVAHSCSYHCVSWTAFQCNDSTQKISMLTIPLYFGFTRDSVSFNDGRQNIFYKTPCGLTIRNMEEMFNYLNLTKSEFTIDQFDFNDCVNPFTEVRSLNSFRSLVDMSQGKEQITISCVNSVNIKLPPQIEYVTTRRAMPGVNLNLDSNFLCGCDCTDNCQDKAKCACWKMTIEGQNILPGPANPNIGYDYRRLYNPVLTGIYECNNTCKCSHSCLNRVVQNPLLLKLQLFMTDKKGWGVRCLIDIPKGSFICNYVGHLYTENDANERGKNDGDEYLAELDYIEVLEKAKEGYEENVPAYDLDIDDTKSEENSYVDKSSDEDFQSTSLVKCNTGVSDFTLELRKRKTKTKVVDSSFHVNSNVNLLPSSKSMREYFGKEESVYIINAKTCGNIGRFLNHSCDPNIFVQNVFVDTHDLRFPWVSYFALDSIKAGTELTWDYGYEVGSVPGKVIECHCESLNCKGRLL